MERIVINYARNRGFNIEKMKKILFEKYLNKNNISIDSLQLDHIIPHCICIDNSLDNLQLLTKREHYNKSKIDFKIIKEFKNKGWIEKITNYSHELKKPIKFLVEEFKKESNNRNNRNNRHIVPSFT